MSDTPDPFYNNTNSLAEYGQDRRNSNEYSVSELSYKLKRSIETTFDHVRVRGEISGFKRAASGHCYFTLKDEKANIDAVIWRGLASKLSFNPEEGLEVIASGKLTTYEQRSRYQIVVDALEPAGIGALLQLLEKRKQALKDEGLFNPEHKKKIPKFPSVIGVISSPTGAVIQDILHRLQDRFPVHVILWPTLVQGEMAAAQICNAIKGFNDEAMLKNANIPRPDVLIVARGGGSLEDLWSFNEEDIVRAVFHSDIPLISAVGHETDTTLIDYVSDLRAPTPSAAAEKSVPVRQDLLYQLKEYGLTLQRLVHKYADRQKHQLDYISRGLLSPKTILENMLIRIDDLHTRLSLAGQQYLRGKTHYLNQTTARLTSPNAAIDKWYQHHRQQGQYLHMFFKSYMKEKNDKIRFLSTLLQSYSYKGVLKRGFTITRQQQNGGKWVPVLSSKDMVQKDLQIEFHDGKIGASTAPMTKNNATKQRTENRAENRKIVKANDPSQGDLF